MVLKGKLGVCFYTYNIGNKIHPTIYKPIPLVICLAVSSRIYFMTIFTFTGK